MTQIAAEESEYASDRRMFAKEFHNRRARFLRIFPGEEQVLSEAGLTESIE